MSSAGTEPPVPLDPADPARAADLDTVAAWLARQDVGSPGRPDRASYDVVVLLGSAVLASVATAAAPVLEGRAPVVVVSGGVGHSTAYLPAQLASHPDWHDVPAEGRPEADVLAEILCERVGLRAEQVLVERASTNCGENAVLTRDLLAAAGLTPTSLLLVQDPTMQRRSHASFARALGPGVRLTSRAPFVPTLADLDGVWSPQRFASLVLGEVRRLHDTPAGYGPRGADFLDHVDVPVEVLAAYERQVLADPGGGRGAGGSLGPHL